MATLADLRLAVRRDLHDLPKPQEQPIDADPTVSTYPFPTEGPILSGSFTLDIDGVVQNPASYTLYESGYVVLPSPPSGSVLHALWQYARYSNEDLNQWIQEAIRELGFVHPKQQTRLHTPISNLQTAHLTSAYTPGDADLIVDSTNGYPSRGVVFTSGLPMGLAYMYTGKTATHFTNISVWVGPDRAQSVGTTLFADDNSVHGWFYDPLVVMDVQKLQGYEPPDEFGIGNGYQDISYFNYDPTTGYLHVEFDFSQLEVGNVGSALAPLDQFAVFTSEMYLNPVNDTDTLDIPDYAINPVSWLATALAQEARETDRDFDYRENAGNDTTANPVLTFQKAGAANRKKWKDWVATQFRASRYPVSRRRMYLL